jgi:4-hydroxy-tetrahydrodipicolinate synthase
MSSTFDDFGLSCALTTPFRPGGACDIDRLVDHARSRLAEGCSSVTLFGTTGEGPSLGTATRQAVLSALAASPIRMREEAIVCICDSRLEDAVGQIHDALAVDCKAILLAPPYYFKHIADDGLFQWYAACFAAVGAELRDVILYNIPQVTAVELTLALIERLKRSFPQVVRGIKDSSGNWSYSCELMARYRDLAILIGDERHLAAAIAAGAKGSISGAANFCAQRLAAMIRDRRNDDRVTRIVNEIEKYPVVAAIKAIVAHTSGDPGWFTPAPPLQPLAREERDALIAAYEHIMAG